MGNTNQLAINFSKLMEREAMQKWVKTQIKEQLKPITEENTFLKEENKNLKEELAALKQSKGRDESEKYGTVRMQLQLLYFIGLLNMLSSFGTLEQKGSFFSILLNRHPQRARKPFSSINELIFSKNSAKAKNIRRDLVSVQKLFELMGLKKFVKKVQTAIDTLDHYHANKL